MAARGSGQLLQQRGHRMGAQRELSGAVVLDHLPPCGHRRKLDERLDALRAEAICGFIARV